MCNLSPLVSIRNSESFGLVYCNAATPIIDLICALFRPHATMFVNGICPEKSLKTSFVSPRKPYLQVLESPEIQYFTVCMNPVIGIVL